MSVETVVFLACAILGTLFSAVAAVPVLLGWRDRWGGAAMNAPSTWSRRMQHTMTLALLACGVLGIIGTYLTWDAGVYKPFRYAYRMHRKELGRPVQGQMPEGAYEAWHDNATIVWMNLLPGFAIMRKRPAKDALTSR